MSLSSVRPPYREELPVLWDGLRVDWLEPTPLRAVTHHGDSPCGGCGSTIDPMDLYTGQLHPEPGATFSVEKERRTKSGRPYYKQVDVPAWPISRLFLYRCLKCGHDEVYDRETDELWILDDSDFGPDGSWSDGEASDADPS